MNFGQDDIKFHCLLFVIGHNMKIYFKLLEFSQYLNAGCNYSFFEIAQLTD